MRAKSVQKQLIMAMFVGVLLGVAGMGCTTMAAEQQQGQPVAGPSAEGQAGGEEVGRVYLDDVRVPSELNYDADESILYETPNFKAGVLHFSKWRLDMQSVIDFFMLNMVKDKWTLVNAFKGKEAQLSFSKPDKTCNIRITETWTGTLHVVIAVGPLGAQK